VHGEIDYQNENGDSVQSDICPPCCDFNKITPMYRQYLHELLDEWLDKSMGTGIFYIGSEAKTKHLQEINDE
jgi:hypothetical protein